jgi:hypothetical protein
VRVQEALATLVESLEKDFGAGLNIRKPMVVLEYDHKLQEVYFLPIIKTEIQSVTIVFLGFRTIQPQISSR